jgi:hypothetical protein
MYARKIRNILYLALILILALPFSALAASRTVGPYTIYFPDDMEDCTPTFDFAVAGAPADGQVTFRVLRLDGTTLVLVGSGAMTYNAGNGKFEGSFSTNVGTGVHTFSVEVTIMDAAGTVLLKTGGKWEVTCEETPPPPGGEGCTPGFWKQSQHLDSWVGYEPTDVYDDVFGVAHFGDLTLLEALNLSGGGANALGRHSVAALLNASSPDVDYDYSVSMVIAAVQEAFATGQYEATKDVFEFYNEQGCPLD